MIDLDNDFKKYFPKLEFKLYDFQKEAINSVINNDGTLCIKPTGGGKSVIYWMSALECSQITLVVSPLIALIDEQAGKLEDHGYSTLVLHAGIDSKKQIKILSDFAKGNISPKFIFASPEKFATDGYFEYCLKQRRDEIGLMVVDEVHCVSQWGISFRPFYKRIPDFLDNLFAGSSWCKILALTATLNPYELNDICEAFRIKKENILKEKILLRSEIQLHVKKFANENEKEAYFWNLLERHKGEKTLVYIYRKLDDRGVEGMCEKATEKGYHAAFFHGELSAKDRAVLIKQYRDNEIDVIFATNAFGMGVDIPDIRTVIHFMIPESAEQYYQEIGRAARDGNGANAYLLYSNKNIKVKKDHFIDKSFPTEEEIRETFTKVSKKVGYCTLPYFEDEDIQKCLPYYLESGLLTIRAKGFSGLKDVYDIKDANLQALYDSTKTKAFVRILKTNDLEAKELSEIVYSNLLNGKLQLRKSLEKWLIIDVAYDDIDDEHMRSIAKSIDEKKKYKYELLDYFVYLLNECDDSASLHQEIARYLGMDKYNLNRIYKTIDGNMVRSKSEVIICDLLAQSGLEYKYEELLEYKPGKHINPDFTIYLPNDKVVYWEHVGCLGLDDYDANWEFKLKVYNEYFPGKLYRTYETGALSNDAKRLIEQLKNI